MLKEFEEQLNVYDLLGTNTDPLYEKLMNLQNGESFEVEEMEVTLNEFGLYELSSEWEHECFSDVSKCFQFINRLLKAKMWNGELDGYE